MEKSPKSNLLLKNLSSHRPLKYLYFYFYQGMIFKLASISLWPRMDRNFKSPKMEHTLQNFVKTLQELCLSRKEESNQLGTKVLFIMCLKQLLKNRKLVNQSKKIKLSKL